MIFSSVMCDWMSLRHDFPIENLGKAFEGGKLLKIDMNGEIEYEALSWEQIRCSSSDTSLRFKCDGRHLWAMGNIGRFEQFGNLLGLSVLECVERWGQVFQTMGFTLPAFGTRNRVGTAAEYGTHLTRLDLAGNFETSDYAALCHTMSVRRIGQKLPRAGKYGPVWGYEAKRSNWVKAKIYDKTSEQAGKRLPVSGATVGRFEVQLGSEFLKQHKLDTAMAWKGDDMEKIIYGKFADQVFKQSVSVEDWTAIPSRLRQHAIMWRDGVDPRSYLGKSQYYLARKKLLDYGIDIGTPCNIIALTRQVRVVEVRPINALRSAA